MASRTTTTTVRTEGATPQEALSRLMEDPLWPQVDTVRLYSDDAPEAGLQRLVQSIEGPLLGPIEGLWFAETTIVGQADQPL